MSELKFFSFSQSKNLAEFLKKCDDNNYSKSKNKDNKTNQKRNFNFSEKNDFLSNKKQKKKDLRLTKKINIEKEDNDRSKSLRDSCVQKLMSSQFRNINQYLYENPTIQAIRYMTPELFDKYHETYAKIVEKWPVKPLDILIDEIKQIISKSGQVKTIADMGCGEAILAKNLEDLNCTVHSFDLIDQNKYITKASIDNVPLGEDACDIVVFCLSLMPTNIKDCIIEANRIMKKNGNLFIAEVNSRFEDSNFKSFIFSMEKLGFKLKKNYILKPDNYFVIFNFKKVSNIDKIKGLPNINLKPCKYKTR